jgi:hypothetical protein
MSDFEPKYPQIEVQLSGEDGNAFFIIGRVRHALQRGGVPQELIDEYSREALSGNYDNVLQTCMRWVNVR